MPRCVRAHAIDGVAYDRIQIERLAMELHAPRLHLVEVQHLGDHPVEPVSVLVDIDGVLAHLFEREVLASHQLREALNARERRAGLAPRATGATPGAPRSYVTVRSSSVAPGQTRAREMSSAFASSSTVPRRISSGSRLARARCAIRFTSASRSARASAPLTESALCMEPATYCPMIIGSWTLSAMRSSIPSPMRRSAPTRRSRDTSGSAAKDFAVARAGSSSTIFFHMSACAWSSARRSDCR